jgi:muramoyltetrapeptide carboxypeptidase
MCKHLAELPLDSEPVQLWHQALQGEPLCYTLPAHPLNRAGQITGRLIGGNLSVLYGLQGTPYSLARLLDAEPDTPAILFIEDIAERHYHIDRMMQNLRMSGVLSRIAGLVVGQFSDCDDDPSMNCSVAETILRATDGYDYPVLFDFPAGHVERNLPLWLNAPCCLSVGNDCLLQSKKYR